jgi:hypothetical protein
VLDDLISKLEGAPPRAPARAPAVPAAPGATTAPTLAELQERLRRIPGEVAALRASVLDGETALATGTETRRMYDSESKALSQAINAYGTATVEEVEQLRAVIVDICQSCAACKERVTSALRT